jgi:hypothetical protein
VDFGIVQKQNGQILEQKSSAVLDSTIYLAMYSLSDGLTASDFFEGIYIYRDSIRTDKEWLDAIPLPKEIQDEFYDLEEYDALVTIDRLLYVIEEDATIDHAIPENWATVKAKANAILTCSIYLYDDEKPYKTFTISDSLFFRPTLIYSDSIGVFKMPQEYLVNNLAITLGEKAASYIVPSWITVERIIHTDYQARMKEAYSYSQAQRWDEAESIWQAEYEKKNKPIEKAKLALNLAVANEMQDKFEPAIDWAEKAKQHFEASDASQQAEEIVYISQYILELQKRIQYNRLLDMQWGREEESH